jgi:streptomycin 6-kinase
VRSLDRSGISGAANDFAHHAGLEWLRASKRGRAWLRALPGLVAECCERWSLRTTAPFPYACASLALPAKLPGGEDVVLKVQFPDRESDREAEALELWNGDGAVLLVDRDGERNALLLERCVPGTPLADVEPDAALDVMVALLPRLWKPAGAPFRSLADEARWWAGYLPEKWGRAGRPFERALLDAGLDALAGLPGTQGEHVLVHQDLHAGNVLRAQREPWLVIDPKPLVGEREFGIAALIRGGELGHDERAIRHRLDRLSVDLSLDRERARAWALAQTLAWAFAGDEVLPPMIDCARWLRAAA